MAWQGLHLSNPARLRLRKGLVYIEPEGGEPVSFHLEDLGYVVIDSPQVTLTAPLLSACAGSGCVVITSDNKHMPNGTLLPFHGYHRQSETLLAQIALSLPARKRLWQRIIRQKIQNQSTCLALLGHDEEALQVETLIKKKYKAATAAIPRPLLPAFIGENCLLSPVAIAMRKTGQMPC